jgi:hypothetical protein
LVFNQLLQRVDRLQLLVADLLRLDQRLLHLRLQFAQRAALLLLAQRRRQLGQVLGEP